MIATAAAFCFLAAVSVALVFAVCMLWWGKRSGALDEEKMRGHSPGLWASLFMLCIFNVQARYFFLPSFLLHYIYSTTWHHLTSHLLTYISNLL